MKLTYLRQVEVDDLRDGDFQAGCRKCFVVKTLSLSDWDSRDVLEVKR